MRSVSCSTQLLGIPKPGVIPCVKETAPRLGVVGEPMLKVLQVFREHPGNTSGSESIDVEQSKSVMPSYETRNNQSVILMNLLMKVPNIRVPNSSSCVLNY